MATSTMSSYYTDTWHGNFDGSAEDLTVLLSRAVDVINIAITMSGYTVNTAPDVVAENVKKAVCAQADYIDAQGGVSNMADSGGVSSATIGKFSYQASDSASSTDLCDQAYQYLTATGLLYRGCSVW